MINVSVNMQLQLNLEQVTLKHDAAAFLVASSSVHKRKLQRKNLVYFMKCNSISVNIQIACYSDYLIPNSQMLDNK